MRWEASRWYIMLGTLAPVPSSFPEGRPLSYLSSDDSSTLIVRPSTPERKLEKISCGCVSVSSVLPFLHSIADHWATLRLKFVNFRGGDATPPHLPACSAKRSCHPRHR